MRSPKPATSAFSTTANSATLYADLIFLESDMWAALRGNGQVCREDNTLTALIEFNSNSSSSQALPLMGTESAF